MQTSEQKYRIDEKEDAERRSDSKDLSIILNEYNRVYLRVFWEKIPKYGLACLVYASLYIVIGCISGYHKTLHIIMQSEHASMKELKNFTYVNYPKLLKILVAPFIDRFYVRTFGRSRTYIALSGSAVTLIFLIMGFYMDDLVHMRRFNSISAIFFFLEVWHIFQVIAANVWSLTLFNLEQRSAGSFVKTIGMAIGEFITYNVFVPLNKLRYSYESESDKPLELTDTALINHTHLCWFIAAVTLLSTLYIVLFIAEKKIAGEKGVHFYEIIRTIPSMIFRKNSMIFLGFVFGCRFIDNLVIEVVGYKMFQQGISRSTVVYIETILFPLAIASGLLCHKFMHKGYLVRGATIMGLINVAVSLSKFCMVCHMEDYRDPGSRHVLVWLFAISAFTSALQITGCIYAYINTIADVRVGSTMLTVFIAFLNMMSVFPKTIGLAIAPYFNFRPFILTCHILEIIVLIGLYFVAVYLDRLDPWDYYTYVSHDEKEALIKEMDSSMYESFKSQDQMNRVGVMDLKEKEKIFEIDIGMKQQSVKSERRLSIPNLKKHGSPYQSNFVQALSHHDKQKKRP